MKIYTKTGDTGTTSLFAGGRVPKYDARVEAYGTVDEVNSWIGVILSFNPPQPAADWLLDIQNVLFVVGADLATPLETTPDWLKRLEETPAQRLETAIDQMDEVLAPLHSFVLPSGTQAASFAHVARTVCRRAERLSVLAHEQHGVNTQVLTYLNRLSDFLFTLARWLNHSAGQAETPWVSRS